VIDLVYYHDKTVDEVAEIIRVPKNTVKTRMFYARKCLGRLLEAHGCLGDAMASKAVH
jgi:RNA polymerase sigma-70 factor, ECF subfamily